MFRLTESSKPISRTIQSASTTCLVASYFSFFYLLFCKQSLLLKLVRFRSSCGLWSISFAYYCLQACSPFHGLSTLIDGLSSLWRDWICSCLTAGLIQVDLSRVNVCHLHHLEKPVAHTWVHAPRALTTLKHGRNQLFDDPYFCSMLLSQRQKQTCRIQTIKLPHHSYTRSSWWVIRKRACRSSFDLAQENLF